MNAIKRIYGPLFTARPWLDTTYLLLDLGIGIALFTIAITMLSVSAGLMITLIGIPLLAISVRLGRWFGIIERTRVKVLLGADLPGPPTLRLGEGTGWTKLKLLLSDRSGWKGLLYGLIMLPWGIFTFTTAVVVWSVAGSMAAFPAFGWAISNRDEGWKVIFDTTNPSLAVQIGSYVLVGVVGLLLLAVAPRVVRGLARLDLALVRVLLSPDESALLAERVSALTVSRDASVSSAAGEIRRIERDLHDGAQQRLVSLAMNLGIAKDRLSEADDPRTVELVGRAHDEAKLAISELRDLVRGIHPAVLTDRGLDAAVSALAARCSVPVDIQSDLARRLPPAIEASAYFVIAEALTNVAKHSHATRASVRLLDRGQRLIVEIQDDGIGGAVEGGGGGLQGLRERVGGAEGQLRIASPQGGPTTLIVELPCGS
jgi:signal transduction histidine kinase